jgi:plastocyanin
MGRKTAVLIGLFIGTLAASWAAPVLAGGGGYGGACLQDEPEAQSSWVAVLDNCFSPNRSDVETGEAVRWHSEAMSTHTVTFADGPTTQIEGGTEWVARFNQAGTYAYVCTFHPGMEGTVVVSGETAPGASIEVVDDLTGNVTESFDIEGDLSGTTSAVERRTVSVDLDPLTAAVVLLLGLPLTLAGTYRLAGLSTRERAWGIRPQLPWRREPREPKRPAGARR